MKIKYILILIIFISILSCAHNKIIPFSGYNKQYFNDEIIYSQGDTTNIVKFVRDNYSPFLLVVEKQFTKVNSDGTLVVIIKGFYITRKEYFKEYNFKIR